jgi:hypothetical protein
MKITKQTISQIKSNTCESKATYLGSAFRKDLLKTPKSVYVLEESNGSDGTNAYAGGLLLATNYVIMRYEKQ